MGFPERLLNDGEHVVVSTRTHVKALALPALVLLVTVFAAAWVASSLDSWVGDDGLVTALRLAVLVLALAVLVVWVLRPFLTWYGTTYTFTDRRFVKRSGIVAREGRTIPLNRISGVDFEIGVVDRLLGCGTLVVSDASEQGRVELHDIPDVERVQMLVAEELHRQSSGRPASGEAPAHDDGT